MKEQNKVSNQNLLERIKTAVPALAPYLNLKTAIIAGAVILVAVTVSVLAICGVFGPKNTNDEIQKDPSNPPQQENADSNGINSDDAGNENEGNNGEHIHVFSQWSVIKEATCEEEGHKTCSCSCGEKEIEIIPATGHHIVNNECTKCGFTYSN